MPEYLTRLLGGNGASGRGWPLPEAFRVILETAHERPVPEGVLCQVLQEHLAYKEAQILGEWGSWQGLCADLLQVLRDGDFITAQDGLWELTPRAVPGRRLNIVRGGERRVQVLFREKGSRQARDLIARTRRDAGELAYSLEKHQGAHPAIARAHTLLTVICGELGAALNGSPPAEIEQEVWNLPEDEYSSADRPDLLVPCRKCGQELPRTQENFLLKKMGGTWYWQKTCHDCSLNGKVRSYQESIIAAVNKLTAELGRIPTVFEVCGQLGTSTPGAIAGSWDRITARGELPAREPEPERKRNSTPGVRSERRAGQRLWYRDWARTAGWHTVPDALRAWNEHFPDMRMDIVQSSAFRHAAREMVATRHLERQGPNSSGAYSYRWTGLPL